MVAAAIIVLIYFHFIGTTEVIASCHIDATAEQQVGTDGKVIDIIILEGGSGYINNNITVSIRGDGEGAEAKAYANFGEEDKLAIGLERGKAYVQGFEIEKVGTTYVTVPKARDYLSSSNLLMTPKVGNFVYVTNLCGIPSFGQMAELEIYDQMTDLSNLKSP